MRIYRHPVTGLVTIYSKNHNGDYIFHQYMFHPIKDCISHFRKKYPANTRSLKGCKRTDYHPFNLGL